MAKCQDSRRVDGVILVQVIMGKKKSGFHSLFPVAAHCWPSDSGYTWFTIDIPQLSPSKGEMREDGCRKTLFQKYRRRVPSMLNQEGKGDGCLREKTEVLGLDP